MKIGRLTVSARRWPWQVRTSSALFADPKTEGAGMRYGWKPTPGMGRFGGGFNWSLGIEIGYSTVILNLLYGMIVFTWEKKHGKV